MKTHGISLPAGSLTIMLLLASALSLKAQTNVESEVPGDNFSLEGALELFKKSSSPEEFEKMLNSPDSRVNNLDLNGDGNTDYIRVIDRNEGNVHVFIMQAVISDRESQDVAVIELEKLEDGKAVLQITGDADVYGMETIIEPTQEVRVNAGTTSARTVVNVWTWPSVQYVYGPTYTVWVSPWRWAYYPFWWHPWRPVAYYVYDPWWRPYRPYYAVCYSHRIGYLPVIYHPYRRRSVVVYHTHRHQIDGYRSRYSGSGSRSDRYASDRYSSNGRSRGGNGRSDSYRSARMQDDNTQNVLRTGNSRSSETTRGFNRDRSIDRGQDNLQREDRTQQRLSDDSRSEWSDGRETLRRSTPSEQRTNRLERNDGSFERRDARPAMNQDRSSMRQMRESASPRIRMNRESQPRQAPSINRSSNNRPSISSGGGNRGNGNTGGNRGGGGRSRN